MMLTPLAPPPPGNHYPGGTPETAFVPILDGVAARLRITNAKAGNRGFSCSLPAGKLLTKNMATSPAPLEAIEWVPGNAATWHRTCTDVVEDSADGTRKVLCTYDGSALPAMPSNANPAGWAVSVHPWLIHDTLAPFDGGFDETYYSAVATPFLQNYIAFVPYFKIVSASTTPSLTDGTDQVWYLYFAKPLNSNQTAALQVSVTTTMFGAATTLAYTVETNAYGQATALKVTVPMATKHVASTGTYKISVMVSQSLYYLKGDTFVTETITLINQEFNVNVALTVDNTPPAIASARIVPKGETPALVQAKVIQSTGSWGGVGVGGFIGGTQVIEASVTENGGGIDRIELWAERSSLPPVLVAQTAYAGLKGTVSYQAIVQTLPPTGYDNPLGNPALTNFLLKAYDMAGNVSSSYAASYVPGSYGVITANPAVTLITPTGGTYSSTTNQWDGCTGAIARVDAPASHVSKVEFYVDSVLKATIAGNQGVPDAAGGPVAWGDQNAYTATFTGLTAGAHTIRAMVYDSATPANTHYLDLALTVGVDIVGGCVDLNAAIALASGATKPAWEVQVGDEVLTRNPFTGELAIKPIGAVIPMGSQPCFKIVGSDGVEGICSASHRIFEANSGAYWTAEDLRVGQALLRDDSRVVTIQEITPVGDREVITFSVNDPANHNYFADGTLAHNMKPKDCVVPGTLVTMADGSQKAIETLIPGEQVLAYDPTTKQFVADTFLSHYITRKSQLFKVTLEDGHELTCTGTHVLFTGAVWLSVEQLRRFTSKINVMIEGGTYSAVKSVEEINGEEVEVRLGEIQNHHNLILGGILCHNIKTPTA